MRKRSAAEKKKENPFCKHPKSIAAKAAAAFFFLFWSGFFFVSRLPLLVCFGLVLFLYDVVAVFEFHVFPGSLLHRSCGEPL